jgi:hypothetical protein
MKNLYKLTAAVILILLNAAFLPAAETVGQVEFNIRFYDRRIYYVQSDPIFVQITITNNSPLPYRFKLADERVFSLDFDIRTMSNRTIPQADSLVRKRTLNQRIFFREISIESGESFSFVEDLRDYVSFTQPGSFRVRAKVYPELIRTATISMDTNYLSLSIRPELIQGPDGIPIEMDIATGAALVRQRLAPDEIVTYMLTARQESQWERFFLYLELEAMLSRDALQRRRYMAENEEGRRRMVNEYRQSLQSSTIDGDIAVIPTTFEILRTVYDNEEGNVTVLEKFRLTDYTELRQYVYYFEKRDNFWCIVNYTMQGNGTEANEP